MAVREQAEAAKQSVSKKRTFRNTQQSIYNKVQNNKSNLGNELF